MVSLTSIVKDKLNALGEEEISLLPPLTIDTNPLVADQSNLNLIQQSVRYM